MVVFEVVGFEVVGFEVGVWRRNGRRLRMEPSWGKGDLGRDQLGTQLDGVGYPYEAVGLNL